MKYYIRGKGDITLSQNDFIFQGGEGKVYGKGSVAFKIYDDPDKMIPEAKIRELSLIPHPNVIRPEDIISDRKGAGIGFTMKRISQSVCLVKLFTNDFRHQKNITNDDALELVEAMKEIVAAVHQAKCLIVDGNEFNYLADDQTFKIPYLIDVNSFQTPSFPATAIMPSIRDPHSSVFTELTDWYSFGIVACQIFTGIHPYKGKHPDYNRKALGNTVMAKRMKDNISIFNPKVTMPPSARDFSCIPKNYFDWFTGMFEKGNRQPPPMKAVPIVSVSVGTKIIRSSHHFDIKLIRQYDSDIRSYSVVYGVEIIKTKHKLCIGKSAYDAAPDTEVIFTHRKARPVLVSIANNRIQFREIAETRGRILPIPVECSEKMIAGNVLYVRNQGNLIELSAADKDNGDIMIAVKSVWQIMPNSSEFFNGVIYQNILGKPSLMIPLPGKSACIHQFVPELEGCRIIDAKHDNHVCILMIHQNSMYKQMVIKFDDQYKRYECRVTEDAELRNVNFTVSDNGIVVSVPEDGVAEVFLNQYGNHRTDIIRDSDIRSEMTLCNDGGGVLFFKNSGLYSIQKKQPPPEPIRVHA